MTAILEGIRVVDMTQYLAGPTVTRLMAEMGADIIKIEQGPHGDPTRTIAVIVDGRSGYYVTQNRGKKSLCLDFDTPEGRAILDDLISRADVLVENYGPGVLEKRGLGYADLKDKHPKLIMASISGFGRTGLYSHKTAFDLIAQAFGGIVHVTGPEEGPPMPVGTSIADVMTGVHAAAAIGFALFHRERTGEGQHLDIAMVDSMTHAHEMAIQGPPLTGGRWKPRRGGEKSSMNAPQGIFASPGGYVALHVMQSQWAGFCRAIGRPDLIDDEKFASIATRHKNRHVLNALIEAWMTRFPDRDEMLAVLEAERVPCAPVLAPWEMADHPYFIDRKSVRTVPDPFLGQINVPMSPLRFSAQPEDFELVAPTLGQHNESILAELGYDAVAVAALASRGVLFSKDR